MSDNEVRMWAYACLIFGCLISWASGKYIPGQLIAVVVLLLGLVFWVHLVKRAWDDSDDDDDSGLVDHV